MARERVPYSQLNTKQREIIFLMKAGWELAMTKEFRTDKERWWIQKGGAGSGQESKRVHGITGKWLVNNGYVEEDRGLFVTGKVYKLTGKDL